MPQYPQLTSQGRRFATIAEWRDWCGANASGRVHLMEKLDAWTAAYIVATWEG